MVEIILRRRRDLLNNLTIKNCDKVEKIKKFKTILVKSLKIRRRFDVIKSIMSKMRTNINVKEFLRDTNKKVKIIM